jgi:hypothetical protein
VDPGILAQAADQGAAARTRPFTVGNHRLGERFPEEQAASVALLVDMLAGAIGRAVEAGAIGAIDVGRSAMFVYRLAVGEMEAHILAGTSPTRADTDAVVAFCLRALGPPSP